MIYRLFAERLPDADTKWLWLAALVFTAALSALALRVFKNKLPRDKGREFAVDGALSAGKVRGAGIVFVCCFIISALLFVPVTLEYVFYYILVFFGMLSGYLDDRSDKPWGEYKKGVIDLIISTLTALCFVHYNPELLNLSFFGFGFHVHPVIYVILGALAVWMLVNAVNCSDGIDGYSSSLTIVSLLSASGAILIKRHRQGSSHRGTADDSLAPPLPLEERSAEHDAHGRRRLKGARTFPLHNDVQDGQRPFDNPDVLHALP